MNEHGWQLIGEQLDSAKALKLWQTVDNRMDKRDIWWNVLLKTY